MRIFPLLLLILALATVVVCDHAGSVAALVNDTGMTDTVYTEGVPLTPDIYLYTLGESAIPADVLKCPSLSAVNSSTDGTEFILAEWHATEVETVQKEPLVLQAGIFGSVKGWLTDNVIAYALTAILSALVGAGGVSGLIYKKVIATFKEGGQFLAVLGSALEDNNISREEIGKIVKEGKDIFAVWT